MPNLRMRPLPGQPAKPRVKNHQKPVRESAAPPGPKEVAYQRKVAAARTVGYRETLLMQLNAVVLHWPRRASAQRSAAEAARLLKNVASELRTAGLRCVEKIVAWVLVESKDCARPRPFLWNGRDYLLKMGNNGYWHQQDFWFARDADLLRAAKPLICRRQQTAARARAACMAAT